MTTTSEEGVTTAEGEDEPDRHPEDLDLDFVPTRQGSVSFSRFGDEVLLVQAATGNIHVLNSTAGLVWECLDGEVSVGELAVELAAAFHTPVRKVRRDTLELVRGFGHLGLLAGVSRPAPEMAPPPGIIAPGEALEPFTARSGEGKDVLVPRKGSAGTILVNWSPYCGYCGKIVAELAECRPALAERGIDLVLFTNGTGEDNARMLDSHGLLEAAVYRRSPEEDPVEKSDGEGHAVEATTDVFGPMGTPVAYFVDAEGVVARPLAYGAAEVPSLVRDAAGLPPEEDSPAAPGTEGGPESARRSLPAASGVCGAGAAGGRKPSRVWAATSAYEIGKFRLGIRADSLETDELLRRAFGDHLSAEPGPAPDNFSVVLGHGSDGPTSSLNLLLAADRTVVRSRFASRVVKALAMHLSDLGEQDSTELLRTTTLAVVVGERALLLPPGARYSLEALQPRLARHDVRLCDGPVALVDPATRELVVREPIVAVADEVARELGDVPSSRTEPAAVAPGRYQLGVWCFEAEPGHSSAMVSRANAVAGALPAVEGDPETVGSIIDSLGQLFDSIRTVPLRWGSRQELVKSVETLIAHV